MSFNSEIGLGFRVSGFGFGVEGLLNLLVLRRGWGELGTPYKPLKG